MFRYHCISRTIKYCEGYQYQLFIVKKTKVMYNGILGIHSLLRWALLLFLVVNIIRVNVEADQHYDSVDKKWSLRMLIVAHLSLLSGLYQYFFGENGFKLFGIYGMKDVMKTPGLRYWAVEHISAMILSIALITVVHSFSKKQNTTPLKKHRIMSALLITALIIIVAAAPWPFRDVAIARPLFKGLY